jgi:hypothetical protein
MRDQNLFPFEPRGLGSHRSFPGPEKGLRLRSNRLDDDDSRAKRFPVPTQENLPLPALHIDLEEFDFHRGISFTDLSQGSDFGLALLHLTVQLPQLPPVLLGERRHPRFGELVEPPYLTAVSHSQPDVDVARSSLLQ